jgi:hypothetical protein
MANYFSGAGFFARFHFIDKETPAIIWKVLGIILWVVAGIWAVAGGTLY